MSLEEFVDDCIREARFDHVGLWQVASASRRRLGAKTTEQARTLSLEIVSRLYERGLRPGDYWGGDFDYWPDEGRRAMLERIEREWIEAGQDPNLGEPICWFAPKPH